MMNMKEGRAVLNQRLREHATPGSKEHNEYLDAKHRHETGDAMKEHERPYWNKK